MKNKKEKKYKYGSYDYNVAVGNCPCCGHIDACGCSLFHQKSHVLEKHPDKSDEFEELLKQEEDSWFFIDIDKELKKEIK